MATGNLLLGTGRRSIGDVVLYRRNGKQVSRVRNRKISNPKSDAQYIQRIILQTVSQAYSRMKAITDHSFETVNGAGNNMSRFMRVNLDRIRAKTAAAILDGDSYNTIKGFSPLKSQLPVPDEWIVSQGTMPQIPIVEMGQEQISIGNSFATGDVPVTYQDICDHYSLQRGDQLTFVCWRSPKATAGPVLAMLRARFEYFRIILDPVTEAGAEAPMSTPFLTEGASVNMPNPRNTRSRIYNLEFDGGDLYVTYPDSLYFMSAAVISSRRNSDGTYSYSPAQMVVDTDEGSVYNAATLEWALKLSKPQNTSESALFLRQATNA